MLADLPGHARGMLGMEKLGLDFCGQPPHQNQLKFSQKNFELLRPLLQEMAALFPDKVFNIGTDETAATVDCPLNDTRVFEEKIVKMVKSFNKTVMGVSSAG
eukprot:SAG22_NODE_2519_length_2486_cov_1.497696_2_plen_102_part_00